jgi:Uma2 family endonuclease
MPALTDIDYPETDDMPMGETELHQQWMIRVRDWLKWRYRGRRVYVGCDLLLYYVEGEPMHYVVPDVFVVHDCDPGLRRIFKTWEEGRVPNVIFEITSRATRRKDQAFKPQTYREIGVGELFLYDPTADYLNPPLQGFRLKQGPQPTRIEPDASGALHCRELDLLLRLEGDGQRLVAFDAATGVRLLTEAEAHFAALQAERAALDSERAARLAAEAELKRLREQLERNSGKSRAEGGESRDEGQGSREQH